MSRSVSKNGRLPAWASAEIFPGGPKSTFGLYFSVCWRCNTNGRTQKMSNVTATVTCSAFPIRKFYAEKMFVLVRMDV